MTSESTFDNLTGDYTLDSEHTRIGFVARHAMVTKVRGSFNDFEGEIHVDGDDPTKSSARVAIKTASIDTRNEQRDGHLRTNDFLDVETYPEITFVSTEIRKLDEHSFELTGDLTIKDTTRPVTIEFEYQGTAKDPFGNVRIGFDGAVTINRKDWGVSWNAPLETGGVLVSEKVTLEFEISAIKAA
ncbi:polyisoprenoid-binding protein YceI [Haloactinopolyspora alba]|uniref:Polyisoprenoid-binding protein YceI n=1 Tax=Haloactinopolyspora alba TaxID=648780 RepID=A0A2P8D702_9ACTN|nr:YceI family protein [Haloactinopolyspora alba]PSK93003.1 polyisoprenoid-binding protein YceI [Haloactinopolyspora alba]